MIIGAPCNQFWHQENGKPAEIRAILRHVRPGKGFEPNFVLLQKADVVGPKAQPLFRYIRLNKPIHDDRDHEADMDEPTTTPTLFSATDVLWNFEKAIIDRKGKVRYRFVPATQPKDIVKYIEELLAEQ